MGNMQYPSKGLLERDLFNVPKVTTGVYCSVTSELFRVNISNDSVSTFLTILFLQETKWKAQSVVKEQFSQRRL